MEYGVVVFGQHPARGSYIPEIYGDPRAEFIMNV
jgi:hypothetical protein